MEIKEAIMSYICLVGNEKGIVACGDSRETFSPNRYEDNRQKVFADKSQGLIWACSGLTVSHGKDYFRLIEFIMRDKETSFQAKLDYIIKSIEKATLENMEKLGSGSAMNILIGHMKKRTMMIKLNIYQGETTRKTFFAPIALDGGSGAGLLPKMNLREYRDLDINDLKKYAFSRTKAVINRDFDLSMENKNRTQTVGGKINTVVLFR